MTCGEHRVPRVTRRFFESKGIRRHPAELRRARRRVPCRPYRRHITETGRPVPPVCASPRSCRATPRSSPTRRRMPTPGEAARDGPVDPCSTARSTPVEVVLRSMNVPGSGIQAVLVAAVDEVADRQPAGRRASRRRDGGQSPSRRSTGSSRCSSRPHIGILDIPISKITPEHAHRNGHRLSSQSQLPG